MVKVKICGITKPEDAEYAIELGADFVGVIVYPKSKRYVPHNIRKDILRASEGAMRVAVMVNPTLDEALKILEEGFDLVQLHGEESLELASGVGKDRVIKAFRVKNEEPSIEKGWKACYAVLLDTFSEKAYGGTGKSFDWKLGRAVVEKGFKVFLSGGLTPSNVREAILKVRPFAVDVSSGVEKEPGIKDKMKVELFIEEAKAL